VTCAPRFRGAEASAARALNNVSVTGGGGGGRRESKADISEVMENTMRAAAEQRQRLSAACCVVAITFPARAAFDFLNAYAALNQSTDPSCRQCDPCQSNQALVGTWINYTPEFQPIVVALSSPLPLSLSLWIITAAHTRAQVIAADMKRLTAFTRS
jgi:hypothetical protein